MILTIKNPRRAELYISAGRHTAAQVRKLTGADVVINGGLYDMGTMAPNCHLRVKNVDYASDPYNYIYGYGWHNGKADLRPVESRNKVTMDNYICCSWMVTEGKAADMVYAPATGGSWGNTAIGRLADGSIVVNVHGESDPRTPEQLQGEMIQAGCVDALRLDGGVSSQLSSEAGEVTSARKVHNYLCIWGEVEKKEDEPLKIYLSPSSQPANIYAVGNTNEQTQCNRIAEYAKTALERCGFEVKKAPEGQSYVSNVNESDAWGADIHVPIHTNAGGGHGPIVFIYSRSTSRLTLAQPVYDALNEIVPTPSKYGVQAKPGLYEIANSDGKCVYIECAFHDDPEEARWIIDNARELGETIAKGLCRGCGVKYIPPAETVDKLYKVQLGAFRERANAEALSAELKKKGYDNFIIQG
ncbi:MAG: N-acetylmuramoyl-L-alanine amidase [Candidatus Heteroscillospira sp.]|jgi:hypothetical protein